MESPKRSAYWRRVKKKWNRKGVVEIDVDNEKYVLLNCIREGLKDLLQNHPELGPKVGGFGDTVLYMTVYTSVIWI